jgi:L-alanine-DL-glutamate epimerase-like enolase superfamily enzyme
MEMLANIRHHTKSGLRVDANAGWTLEQALTNIPVMKEAGY